MKLKFKINLTGSQKEAYQATEDKNVKYLTLVWSRQSGKSTLMQVLCVKWLFKKNVDIGYVCRNYILAKKIYKSVVKLIPAQYVKSANGSDLIIETVLGSTLTFFSAESGASLRGLTFDYLIMDEFAFFKQQQTDGTHLYNDILSPTVKVKGKKVIFVSTPLGKNNLFYEMYKRGLSSSYPKYRTIKKDIYSDGLIDSEGIEELKQGIPELSFRQEYLCEFLDGALTFFKGFDKCFINKRGQSTENWIGIDLSGDGQDATILTIINQANETCQKRIEGTLDAKYAQIANVINTTPNLKGVYVEVNGLGMPMYNEIKKLVKNKSILNEWLTTNSSKEEIISELAVDIANESITFEENADLYEQLSNFICKYTKTGKLQFEGANGTHDDKVMSLAIANKAKKELRVVSKPSFIRSRKKYRVN